MQKNLKFIYQKKQEKARFIIYQVKNKATYLFIAGIFIVKLQTISEAYNYLQDSVLETLKMVQVINASQFQNYKNFIKKTSYEPRQTCFISDQILTIG